MGEISWLSSFKTVGGIKSGPVALCGLAGYRVRLSRPSVLADLDAVPCICLIHGSLASMVTPRWVRIYSRDGLV